MDHPQPKPGKATPRQTEQRSSIHSKMVVDAMKSVVDLAASLAVQSTTVSTALVERLETVLEEGEEMPDVKLLIELMGRLVKRSGKALDEADQSRFEVGIQQRALRREIGESHRALHDVAVRVRKTLVDLYGSARCRFQFGFSERTPRGAEDLALETRRLVDRLANPRFTLPDPEVPGLVADPESWVASLAPVLERLERALEQRGRRQTAVDDGVIGCRRALAACERTTLQVARWAEALFILAGEHELARRLRPKARQRARQAEPQAVAPPATRLRLAAAHLVRWLRRILERVSTAARAWLGRRGRESRKTADCRLADGSPKAKIA